MSYDEMDDEKGYESCGNDDFGMHYDNEFENDDYRGVTDSAPAGYAFATYLDDDSESVPVTRLSLEEARNQNLERNRQFLANLFGSSEAGSLTAVIPEVGILPNHDLLATAANRQTAKVSAGKEFRKRHRLLELLSYQFPHRREFLSKLCGYLMGNFVPANALLIQGPSGTGKSSTCHTALSLAFATTYARVNCDTFSTSKQLLKAIWFAVLKVKFNLEMRSRDNKGAANKIRKGDAVGGCHVSAPAVTEGNKFASFVASHGLRPPSNFGDLVAALGTIVDSILEIRHFGPRTIDTSHAASHMGIVDSELEHKVHHHRFGLDILDGRPRKGALHLMLDRVDAADILEKGLAGKLLRLSDLCHSRIKVLSTLVQISPRIQSYHCVPITLSPYTDKELRDILVARARATGFVRMNFSGGAVESSKAPTSCLEHAVSSSIRATIPAAHDAVSVRKSIEATAVLIPPSIGIPSHNTQSGVVKKQKIMTPLTHPRIKEKKAAAAAAAAVAAAAAAATAAATAAAAAAAVASVTIITIATSKATDSNTEKTKAGTDMVTAVPFPSSLSSVVAERYTALATNIGSTTAVDSTATAPSLSMRDPSCFAHPKNLDAFAAVLNVALPQLLFASRDIMELWQMSFALWQHICTSMIPDVYIQPPLEVLGARSGHMGKSIRVARKAVERAVGELLALPVMQVDHIQGFGKRATGGMKVTRPHSKEGSDATESVNMRSQAEPSRKGHAPSTWLNNVLTAIDAELVMPRQWYVHMPLSHKYLLVAAFLASHNPKESDEFTFAGKKRSKKRKVRAGQDDDAQAGNNYDNTGSCSSSSAGGGGSSGGGRGSGRQQSTFGLRIFSLDRLASIFAQIASTGGVEKLGGGARAAIALGHSEALQDGGEFTAAQIAESYGDADFFSTIHSMVENHYLVKATSWTLDRPQFIATIDEALAMQLAKSLSFNLQDYMSGANG